MSLASTHPTINSLNFRFSATISMAESERNGQYNTLERLMDPLQCEAIKEEGKISSVLVSWKMKIFHSNKENPQFTDMILEYFILKTEWL
jgi:hypothetical protein